MSRLDPIDLQVMLGALQIGLRRDGRGAGALGPLGQHQGAPRRLHRPVRRPGADGHAGRAHPRSPGGHAQRRGRRARGGPLPRRRMDPQRPLRRRHPPARHHGRQPGVRGSSGGAQPTAVLP
ncbi:MAG: hypothetical protein WKF40_06755 [Thermoleophilaceae bacterium]